jgi:hypothetical protein
MQGNQRSAPVEQLLEAEQYFPLCLLLRPGKQRYRGPEVQSARQICIDSHVPPHALLEKPHADKSLGEQVLHQFSILISRHTFKQTPMHIYLPPRVQSSSHLTDKELLDKTQTLRCAQNCHGGQEEAVANWALDDIVCFGTTVTRLVLYIIEEEARLVR